MYVCKLLVLCLATAAAATAGTLAVTEPDPPTIPPPAPVSAAARTKAAAAAELSPVKTMSCDASDASAPADLPRARVRLIETYLKSDRQWIAAIHDQREGYAMVVELERLEAELRNLGMIHYTYASFHSSVGGVVFRFRFANPAAAGELASYTDYIGAAREGHVVAFRFSEGRIK